MRMKLFGLTLLFLAPAISVAQERDLEVLRDSLSNISNVSELRQRETALSKGPQARAPTRSCNAACCCSAFSN
jgi:hypothetical protein